MNIRGSALIRSELPRAWGMEGGGNKGPMNRDGRVFEGAFLPFLLSQERCWGGERGQ